MDVTGLKSIFQVSVKASGPSIPFLLINSGALQTNSRDVTVSIQYDADTPPKYDNLGGCGSI